MAGHLNIYTRAELLAIAAKYNAAEGDDMIPPPWIDQNRMFRTVMFYLRQADQRLDAIEARLQAAGIP